MDQVGGYVAGDWWIAPSPLCEMISIPKDAGVISLGEMLERDIQQFRDKVEVHLIIEEKENTMSQANEQKPSVGRIVHYVLDKGRYKGAHRPAIVVNNWEDVDYGVIQLQVFTDGKNDSYPDAPEYELGVCWRTSVHQDEETKAPGTWHWPERV